MLLGEFDTLLQEADSQVKILIAQADLAATGASIHDIRVARAGLLYAFGSLDLAVKAMADSLRIYPLQKEFNLRIRILRRILTGERGHSRIFIEEVARGS